jgi:hypothetical protein
MEDAGADEREEEPRSAFVLYSLRSHEDALDAWPFVNFRS